jgi:hypothetical protein
MARHILPTRVWKMQAHAVALIEIKRRAIKRAVAPLKSNVARVALFEKRTRATS